MSSNQTPKVLVIGGSGFLGSHISEALGKSGFQVFIHDKMEAPKLCVPYEFLLGDLSLKSLIRSISEMDYVFNVAAEADIAQCNENPITAVNANILGATNVFEACKNSTVKKVILASSLYVSGNMGGFYRATKLAAEELLKCYYEQYGVQYTILRFGSLYGPRSQDWNGLRKYVSQIYLNGEITYRGNGDERREYIHVEDAAKLAVQSLDERYNGRQLVLSGSQSYTAKQILDLIFEIVGRKPNIIFNETTADNDHYKTTPYRFNADKPTKISPTESVDFGQGIADLIAEVHEANNNTA